MVVILVFLTFFFAILVGGIIRYMATRREASVAKFSGAIRADVPSFWVEKPDLVLSPATLPSSRESAIQFPKDIYYHKGHAWAKLEGDKKVSGVWVGLDDFTQKVMGEIDTIELPPVGAKLSQGEVAWRVHRGKRTLNQLAPLSGTVVEVNEKVVKDPSIVNRSPYEKGWIMKIQPSALREEITKLMDSFQFQVTFDQLKAKLRSSIGHQTLGAVYSDGEELVQGIVDHLDEKSWRLLVTELFHTSTK